MADTGKKIDRYIDSLLSQAEVPDTSPEFTKFLMERVGREYRSALEERKRDRIARYIIGFLTIFILGVSITIGYVFGSKESTTSSPVVDISPAVETSRDYLQRFIDFVLGMPAGLFDMLGLSLMPQTVSIILSVVGIIALFAAADRVFLKGKFINTSGK